MVCQKLPLSLLLFICWFGIILPNLYPNLNFICFLCIYAESVTTVNGTAIAEPITRPSLHDLQVYGIVVTIVLCFIVFGGVKMINRVAPAFLIPVFLSLCCIFLGIFVARKDRPEGLHCSNLVFFSEVFFCF